MISPLAFLGIGAHESQHKDCSPQQSGVPGIKTAPRKGAKLPIGGILAITILPAVRLNIRKCPTHRTSVTQIQRVRALDYVRVAGVLS
jgi:hypothetical protein